MCVMRITLRTPRKFIIVAFIGSSLATNLSLQSLKEMFHHWDRPSISKQALTITFFVVVCLIFGFFWGG